MSDINGGTDSFAPPSNHALNLGMERYFILLRQQAELSRQLAVGWAGAVQTMSGMLLTQTTTMGQLVAIQTGALADQAKSADTATGAERADRRPTLGLVQGESSQPVNKRKPSSTVWADDQEHLRNNVFDEVIARLLEDDIEEAVV